MTETPEAPFPTSEQENSLGFFTGKLIPKVTKKNICSKSHELDIHTASF